MKNEKPIDLGYRVAMVDGYDMGIPQMTCSYILMEEKLTLIETGSSPSVPYIINGLAALDLKPEEVEYIIVTHIHLDHAGGVGLLLESCPKAKVVVHPRGARHLIDPSRLIESAKAVYGEEQFEKLFHPIKPVPEERVIIMEDEDTLQIGPERILRFLDTPGHARHHFSIYDPASRGIFSGDTIGLRYPTLEARGITLFAPVTSPNQFDPEEMKASIERIYQSELKRVYFGHFGMSVHVEEIRRQVLQWLDRYVDEGEKAYRAGQPVEHLIDRLLQLIVDEIKEYDVREDQHLWERLKMDAQLCAMGIYDYLSKKS